MRNLLLLLQTLAPLLASAGASVPQSVAPPSAPAAPAQQIDPAVLTALLATLQAEGQTNAPESTRLSRAAAVVAGVVVTGFFAALAAIVGMLAVRPEMDRAGDVAALIALSIGFGVLCSKFGTVVDLLVSGRRGPAPPSEPTPATTIPAPSPLPPLPEVSPAPEPGPAPAAPPPTGVGKSTDKSTATARRDIPPDGRPASIRYNNPGAQYPSERAAAFGQIGYGIIGGEHKIALFPHPINGAASNFDLLSRGYVGMTIGAAGAKWTGDNGFGIPGYDSSRVLTAEMIRDPAQAIPILKAIARREAGRESPLTDEEWTIAHAMFRHGSADAWLRLRTPEPLSIERPSFPGKPAATGVAIVALAKTRIGERYVNVLVPKDDASWHGPWDCAEFASWLVYQVAEVLYGCTNDSNPPRVADAYTGAWRTDAQTKGKMVSVEEAARTPGAFLLRYPPTSGAMGHIAVSDGQGGTIEAAGSSTGVVAGKVSGRRWDTGVLVPGIDYSSGAVQVVVSPVKLYAIGQPNMDAAKVREIQVALAAAGFSPGDPDGEYGEDTANAVGAFQTARGLVSDGEVGPDTAAALGVTL